MNMKDNGWITKETRLVLVAFSVYNQNIDGAFASVVLEIRFTAPGGNPIHPHHRPHPHHHYR